MQLTLSKKTLYAILTAPLAAVIALGKSVAGKSESALVARAKNRDPEAFRLLMESHSVRLKKLISRRVETADREDVYQDTCLAAWEALPKFDHASKLGTWLYSICYHKIQDYWRREQCRPPSYDVTDAEGRCAYLPREFGSVELHDALKEFWAHCTPDQRELLRLYYSDGLTLNEISRMLGRNLNTLKYQFYRVHSEAREQLAEHAGSEAWLANR